MSKVNSTDMAKEHGFIDLDYLKEKYPCDRLIQIRVGKNWFWLMLNDVENEIGDCLTLTGHKISDLEAEHIEKYGRGFD